jgi:hypothetical protein
MIKHENIIGEKEKGYGTKLFLKLVLNILKIIRGFIFIFISLGISLA